MTLMIAAASSGVFLGLYYNFLVLIPVTLFIMTVCFAPAVLGGYSTPSALFGVVIPAVALQGGYMIGLTTRDLLGQFQVRRKGEESKRA